MQFVVGLGNPGVTYALARHNIGFMVIDTIIQRLATKKISKQSFEGELFKSSSHFLLKPTTFMNLSGKSVLKIKKFYKLDMPTVIHDDIDLPFGAIRFKFGGSSGGHNGIKSIDNHIGNEYLRVRMGVGKPKQKSVVDFVLSQFCDIQKSYLDDWIYKAANAVCDLLDSNWQDISFKYSQKKIMIKENDL